MLKRWTKTLIGRREAPKSSLPAAEPTADLHPTAVLYPTASIQSQGWPKERISVGAHSHIRGELLLFGHGGQIRIGSYCYVGEHTRIWSGLGIEIGDRVLISHGVTIMDNLTHPIDPVARHKQFREIITTGHPKDIDLGDKVVVLEDDALVACQCVILRGVRIGRGAVIGAGSVVTSHVPPMTIYAGNPAKFIRAIEP